ncbi:hypothetical protein GGX14DRAFT_399080 [Mycena pura]|uniref:Uncharacterized protein n=1 Tax=Mycena pura TaxID=153505 RepID=A0AAD6V7L4_9AGAR|nr:hypothetical protein GGX14DRAFT_399080 [Mycena pura]
MVSAVFSAVNCFKPNGPPIRRTEPSGSCNRPKGNCSQKRVLVRAHGRSPPTRRGRTKGNMEKWLVENENLETNSKLEQLRLSSWRIIHALIPRALAFKPLYRCWGIAEYLSRLKDSSSPDVMSVETSMGQRDVSLDSCRNEPFQESEEVSNPKRNYPNFRGGGWFMK